MRHNYVFLRGLLRDVCPPSIITPVDLVEVHFQVVTGNLELGEPHPVVAFGKLAVDILAAEHAGLVPAECLLEGWLRSDGCQSWTVAQELTMHLNRNQRKRLRWQIQDLKSHYQVDV